MADGELTLPAISVAVAVKLYVPSANAVGTVLFHSPLALAYVVATNVLPLYSVTVLSTSAVPEKVGVVSLVMPSLADTPVSSVMPNTIGEDGGVLSRVAFLVVKL